MPPKRALTGIQPSGVPHVGNLKGMIEPAIQLQDSTEPYYFIASFHALTTTHDAEIVRKNQREAALTFLAFGLDPARAALFRQEDVPEVTELAWILGCFVNMGALDRAHAVKAARDAGREINLGTLAYPVLMAADILLYDSDLVPVGKDQKQHVEMARDMALSMNHHVGREVFHIPEPLIREDVATVPGLDGRKMSKSYDNTIPLFAPREQLKKLIFSIVTDSRAPGEAKDTEGSALFQLYQAFASAEETAAMRAAFADGIGWGDAKQTLFDRIDQEVAPLRERYNDLMAKPAIIEEQLRDNAVALRERHATPLLRTLREAVGLRDLSKTYADKKKKEKERACVQAKQYRENDGMFYYKIVDSLGNILFISSGFTSGREAAQDKHTLALLEEFEAKALTENHKAVSVDGGFRFEMRTAENRLMGHGPTVKSADESERIRASFLENLNFLQ